MYDPTNSSKQITNNINRDEWLLKQTFKLSVCFIIIKKNEYSDIIHYYLIRTHISTTYPILIYAIVKQY